MVWVAGGAITLVHHWFGVGRFHLFDGHVFVVVIVSHLLPLLRHPMAERLRARQTWPVAWAPCRSPETGNVHVGFQRVGALAHSRWSIRPWTRRTAMRAEAIRFRVLVSASPAMSVLKKDMGGCPMGSSREPRLNLRSGALEDNAIRAAAGRRRP